MATKKTNKKVLNKKRTNKILLKYTEFPGEWRLLNKKSITKTVNFFSLGEHLLNQ